MLPIAHSNLSYQSLKQTLNHSKVKHQDNHTNSQSHNTITHLGNTKVAIISTTLVSHPTIRTGAYQSICGNKWFLYILSNTHSTSHKVLFSHNICSVYTYVLFVSVHCFCLQNKKSMQSKTKLCCMEDHEINKIERHLHRRPHTETTSNEQRTFVAHSIWKGVICS